MIKDKFTSQLKDRLLKEIKLSREAGKERGFFMCIDEKGFLSPSKICEGDACSILMEDPRDACLKGTNQGDFHSHPYITEAKKELERRGEKIPTDDALIGRMEHNIKVLHEKKGIKDITINSPTYDDLLHAILAKYVGFTKGTVCTASDAGKDTLECWTAKDMDDYKFKIYAAKANSEIRKRTNEEEGGLIEKWIESVFDREIIDLKE